MPTYVQFLNYNWGVPASLGGLEPSGLTSFTNSALGTLQEKGAAITDIRPSYLINEGGVVIIILYEADKPINI